ncbi:MAG: hypothetical protein R3C62_05985 [Chloroflexota bacterium]
MIDSKRIKQRAKLTRPLLIPLILYIGLLIFATSQAPVMPTPVLRYAVALLPVVPGLFLGFGMVRAVAKLDELERRILLEAAAFSFGVTLILLVSLGLLSEVGVPVPNPMLLAAIMAILLIVGKLWGNWRA